MDTHTNNSSISVIMSLDCTLVRPFTQTHIKSSTSPRKLSSHGDEWAEIQWNSTLTPPPQSTWLTPRTKPHHHKPGVYVQVSYLLPYSVFITLYGQSYCRTHHPSSKWSYFWNFNITMAAGRKKIKSLIIPGMFYISTLTCKLGYSVDLQGQG